ncbi:MAG: NAD-dependent epimerase/dehydratase family protein, partial [bacterium]|nr:NAD-dependent epimerase/dehydratase family protein [bacterium]
IVIDNLSTGKKENLNSKAEFHNVDIRNLDDIRPLFKGVDGVFHLAALPSVPLSIEKPDQAHDINVNGTLNVFLAAKDSGIRRVIYSSSCSVYGDNASLPQRESDQAAPNTPYALHKYIGEQYASLFSQIYKLPIISLRYFNVYGRRMPEAGPYSGVIKVFSRQKQAGELLTITGDGEQSRDFVFIDDVVRANLLAMVSDKVAGGDVINIGSGQNYTINKLADLFGGEKKYIESRVESRTSLANIGRAEELLGWEPSARVDDVLNLISPK